MQYLLDNDDDSPLYIFDHKGIRKGKVCAGWLVRVVLATLMVFSPAYPTGSTVVEALLCSILVPRRSIPLRLGVAAHVPMVSITAPPGWLCHGLITSHACQATHWS